MKRIHLHIDRLVLRGFRPKDGHGVAAGLEQELMRMLSDPWTARQLAETGDVSRLKIGTMKIARDAKPQQVGSRVAQHIGKRIEQ